MSSVLTATNLQKTYRTPDMVLTAVKDVSLSIDRGEVLAFLGPNGAGKTTSIKMIAGLITKEELKIIGDVYSQLALQMELDISNSSDNGSSSDEISFE